MAEKIYIFSTSARTLHIEGFCPMASPVGNELFETEEAVIKAKGKSFKMCQNCEKKKEMILQNTIKVTRSKK